MNDGRLIEKLGFVKIKANKKLTRLGSRERRRVGKDLDSLERLFIEEEVFLALSSLCGNKVLGFDDMSFGNLVGTL